jgi:hypothetical protein
MKKHLVLFLSAVLIEFCSTYYIISVSNRELIGIVFFAFIGPFINLPFLAYQIDAKTTKERLILASVYAFGYAIGAIITTL